MIRPIEQIQLLIHDYPWPISAIPSLPADWHITLSFLGQATHDQYQHLLPLIDTLTNPVIDLEFNELAYWPQAKVLVLLPNEIPPSLTFLVSKINDLLKSQHWPIEPRAYQPHLTLAHHFSLLPKDNIRLGVLDRKIDCYANTFYLADSSRADSSTGKRYQILNTWPLNIPLGELP